VTSDNIIVAETTSLSPPVPKPQNSPEVEENYKMQRPNLKKGFTQTWLSTSKLSINNNTKEGKKNLEVLLEVLRKNEQEEERRRGQAYQGSRVNSRFCPCLGCS
jgi:hypothetical protein